MLADVAYVFVCSAEAETSDAEQKRRWAEMQKGMCICELFAALQSGLTVAVVQSLTRRAARPRRMSVAVASWRMRAARPKLRPSVCVAR